jgi:hypothetical protein
MIWTWIVVGIVFGLLIIGAAVDLKARRRRSRPRSADSFTIEERRQRAQAKRGFRGPPAGGGADMLGG